MKRHVSPRLSSGYLFVLIFVILALSSSAICQQQEKLVILNHADSLVGIQINGQDARKLTGNVRFTQGKIVVTCQSAIQYLKSNKAEFEGEVKIHDDSIRMTGNKGNYDGNTKVAIAYDGVVLDDKTTHVSAVYGEYSFQERRAYFSTNVIVEDTASTLTAGELTYYRDQQKSIADNEVSITNKDSTVTILGNHFENLKREHYSRMTGSPKLIQTEKRAEATPDTLVVTSRVMESYQDSLERLIATGNVALTRPGFAAEADTAIFFTQLDSILLRKKPIIWYIPDKHDENQVTGDSMFIKLNKRKLQTVNVKGSAIAISRADSVYQDRFNQLTGQELIMMFFENKVQRIEVDRTATSLYYLFDGKKANGMNKTSGDHITFSFKDGKIDKIKVIGGVEGQYFPERMIDHRETSYNLPGFDWRENRPSYNR